MSNNIQRMGLGGTIAELERRLTTKFHTCPVCKRGVCQTHGVLATFARHSDGVGGRCPMSDKPIPPPSAAEVRSSSREYRRPRRGVAR